MPSLNSSISPSLQPGYPKSITQMIEFNIETKEDEDFVSELQPGSDYYTEMCLILADIGLQLVSIKPVVS